MARVNIKSPLDIRKDKLKVLICPDWQRKNQDGSARTNEGCCDGVYEFVNDLWISQSASSKQALWKKDNSFGGKWTLKFDGIDDEYFIPSFEPITSSDKAQVFAVWQIFNKHMLSLFSTPRCFLYNHHLSVRCNGLFSGFYNNTWHSGNVSSFVRRADPRFFPGWSYQSSNGVAKIQHLGYGDGAIDAGFAVGSKLGEFYYPGRFAFLAIWEDEEAVSIEEINQLMEFGKYHFNCYRNYDL